MNKINDHIIFKYLNNSCTPEELNEILRWLEADKENQKDLFELEEIYDIRRIDEFENNLHNIVVPSIPEAKKRPIRRQLLMWCSAAAIALIFIISVWTLNYQQTVKENAEMLYTVAIGENLKEIQLPDGSLIWLTPSSTLKVENWEDSERNVYLDGEAYFSIAKDTSRPFRVATENYTVKVLGTSFNVKSYPASPKTETTLVEGKVEIENKDRKTMVTLAVGQKAEYDKTTGQMTVTHVENVKDISLKKDGFLVFDKMTSANIFDELARAYGIPILTDSLSDNSTEYSGVIKKSHKIEQVLYDLSFVFPFNYHYARGGIKITPIKK